MKKEKSKPVLFKIACFILKIFYKNKKYIGVENMPDEPSIYVANHVQMAGPLTSEFYFPKQKKIWCIGEMLNIKEAPNYSYDDFWPNKNIITKPIFRLISYIISPILVYVLKNADTIAVYKDARLMKTYRDTMKSLDSGDNIIIFPEYREKYNEIINDFLDKYIDVARLYYKKTGKELNFVPMYHAPKLGKILIGNSIKFNALNDIVDERLKINNYLKEEITKLAKSLPRHKVVPYENVKRKYYRWSKDDE